MKRKSNRWLKMSVAVTLASLGLRLGCCNGQTPPRELIWALSISGDQLVSFWSDDPGAILDSQMVTGLQPGEQLEGISYWDGNIYGLGSDSRLYVVNPLNGQVAPVGNSPSPPSLSGSAFGFANTPAGARAVSELDINLNISRTTGTASAGPLLSYAAGDRFGGTSPNMTSLAYDPQNGSLYALDSVRKTLATVDPNTGVVTTLTPNGLGIDFSRYSGFGISATTGLGYLGSPAGADDPQANLYTLDPATGDLTLVGLIGEPGEGPLTRSLTVIPTGSSVATTFDAPTVPEPNSVALLALGVAGWFLVALRRNR